MQIIETKPVAIVETTWNALYQVSETGYPDMQHVWYGMAVKRTRNGFEFKKNARTELVRKEGCKIVSQSPTLFASKAA